MDIPAQTQIKILIHCPQCRGDIEFLEEAHVIRCEFCGSSLLVAGREGVLRYVLSPKDPEPGAVHSRVVDHLRQQGRRSPRVGDIFLLYAPYWRMRALGYVWFFGLLKKKISALEAWADKAFRPHEGDEITMFPTHYEFPMPEYSGPQGTPYFPAEREKILQTRVIDHTIPAYTDLEIGLSSLGVRSQALVLHPFSKEHLELRNSFLPLEIPLERAQAEADSLFHSHYKPEGMTPEVILEARLGKSYSVIYFPLWVVQGTYSGGRELILVDGTSQNIIKSIADGAELWTKLESDESRKSFEFSEIRFLPFRCPNCGWAFPFRPVSVLHFCSTCRHLWCERNGDWIELNYQAVLPSSEKTMGNFIWIPFWRWRATLESAEGRLSTLADLYRLAPPTRVFNPEEMAQKPILFYVPALKFRNPKTLQTLASRFTSLQPVIHPLPFPDGSHPSTAGGSLAETDAYEMGPVILGSLIPPKNRKAVAWLNECRAELQNPQVLYFPFSQKGNYWQELTTGISFQTNALTEDLSAKEGKSK
jgi:DNA-directed RNA polymerase subunit RPC12/RpoP